MELVLGISFGVSSVLTVVLIVVERIRRASIRKRNRSYKDFYDDSKWDEIFERVPKNRLSKSRRKNNSGGSYRKRNKFSLLLLGADTNVSNELGINNGFDQIKSFIKEKIVRARVL